MITLKRVVVAGSIALLGVTTNGLADDGAASLCHPRAKMNPSTAEKRTHLTGF